jgi:hypothetical protein
MCRTIGIRGLTLSTSCFLWLLASLCLTNVSASPVVFTLVGSSSQLTASGTFLGGQLFEQSPGSLTTSFSGTINADLTATNIHFTGGSLITAQTNGIWEPAVGGFPGSGPADFGATNNADLGPGGTTAVPGNLAVRNLLLDVTNSPLAMTNGGFDGGSLVFTMATNNATIDYYYALPAATTNEGTGYLNGDSTNAIGTSAMLSTNGGVRQLVLHVNALFIESVVFPRSSDMQLYLTGQLVATNAAPIPPAQPIIQSIVKIPPNVAITTLNTTAQSVLMVSTNLNTWTSSSATISTNGMGLIVFTTPISVGSYFYRVQQ